MHVISPNPITEVFQDNAGKILFEQSSDVLQRLKTLNFSYFFTRDEVLVNKFKVIDPVDLTSILQRFFREMIEEGCIHDPVKFLDRLADIVPLEKIQKAVEDNVSDALMEAKDMLAEAKTYFEMSEEHISPSIRLRISLILDGIVSVLESVIKAYGIADFFKPAESDIHADFKSQKIMMLLSLFSMITQVIIPILGGSTGGLVIGGVLLVIAALSTIWPFIKPKPTYLPAQAQNWTKQVQNGGFVAQGRKESLDGIADIFKMNHHAILVGLSRVGKSLTAKAFAQAVERGDYPELKGKVVFRINMADIAGQQNSLLEGANGVLTRISEAMGRHRKDIILVFDEAHMACKNNEKLADQLKPFLDEGGEFPLVIAITTEEEYNKYVKDNTAFSLRFDRVDIVSTSRYETLKILSDTVLKSRSKPLISDGALDYIYDKSCEPGRGPQPTASLKLLKRCIVRTQKTQKSATEKKIIEIENKILSLRSSSVATFSRKKELRKQVTDLENQLQGLQEVLAKEKNELDGLFKAKSLLNRVTKETYLLILKIAAVAQKKLNAKLEKQLKIFLLLREFLSKSLEEYVVEKSEKLGIKGVIDQSLIEEIANM